MSRCLEDRVQEYFAGLHGIMMEMPDGPPADAKVFCEALDVANSIIIDQRKVLKELFNE